MLSVYSVIKPPKSGNCSVLEEDTPVISIEDLKDIIKEQNIMSERENKIHKFKSKIDQIVNDELGISMIYFKTIIIARHKNQPYIIKRLKSQTKCSLCINSMNIEYIEYGQIIHLAADLVNLKTRGFLTHPNHHIYTIIKFLETSFSIYADSINVFEDTYEDFFKNEHLHLKWKCAEHRIEIFSNIFVLFFTMRIRQQRYSKNIEQIGKNK
ncbi:hypothetical protein AGLY_017152 [Aphis glycines]|uniref:Uncharacterized protein n=1 Tax=Aphis glycines TaxID=307491 RepID=A0A6G0SXS4_APHGL|nr:hypothetical protein AGLY_017152 [Aphis glycines]